MDESNEPKNSFDSNVKKEEGGINNEQIIETSKGIPNQETKVEENTMLTQTQLQSQANITDIIVQQNPTLELEEVSGDLLKDKLITINAAGIVNGGLRGKRDGFTYFGPHQSQNSVIINDYLINLPNNIEATIPTLFNINFNLSAKNYFLSPGPSGNCSEATIFMKIESLLKIEKKLFISLGEIHFTVDPNPRYDYAFITYYFNSSSQIAIDITYDSNKTKHYDFDKEQKVIKIGRGKKSDILLYHLSYSRTQTTIVFKEDENAWLIQDGFEEKTSTNGTWAFLNWDWKVDHDVQFRIGQNLLKLNLIQ